MPMQCHTPHTIIVHDLHKTETRHGLTHILTQRCMCTHSDFCEQKWCICSVAYAQNLDPHTLVHLTYTKHTQHTHKLTFTIVYPHPHSHIYNEDTQRHSWALNEPTCTPDCAEYPHSQTLQHPCTQAHLYTHNACAGPHTHAQSLKPRVHTEP